MSTSKDFERVVATFLERQGPVDVDPEVVDGALLEIGGLQQRRGRVRFAGSPPWPARAPWLQLDAGAIPAAWIAVMLLLVAAIVASAAVGASLLGRRSPAPTVAPAVVTIDGTPAPVPASAEPARTPGPFASGEVAAGAPCPPMLQLVGTYVVDAGGDATVRELGKGDVMYVAADGTDRWIRRVRRDGNAIVPDDGSAPDGFVFPSLVPPTPTGRIVPSPGGRAIAIEEGDLGQAGCGDPIVVFEKGGRTRPFPAGAFQLVGDLAWAPDGSALYAVRRPTVDANGKPYWDADIARPILAPGTVLRWDAATGETAALPSGCGSCRDLTVSPDGARLAAWGDGRLWAFEDGAWRSFFDLPLDFPTDYRLLQGWADPTTVVTTDRRVIGLDGTVRADWPEPCCHGTGFTGLLSPDGTTLAGIRLNEDFQGQSLTLLDLGTGTTRDIWTSGRYLDCAEHGLRPQDPACEADPTPSPDPMAMSGYARVAAWAPDGSAVLVAQPFLDSTRMRLWVVPVDGSGPGPGLDVQVPDLSGAYGFPNEGSGLAWLPLP